MSVGIVVAHGQVERAVAIEVDPLDAMRRSVPKHLPGDDLGKVISGVVVHLVMLVDRTHDVGGDVEVRPTVVVVVAPSRGCCVVSAEQVQLQCDIAECAIALVAVEQVLSIACDEEIEQSIVVVVDDRGPAASVIGRAPRLIHLHLAGDVNKLATIVPKKAVEGSVLIRRKAVEPAILVEVKPDSSHSLSWVSNAHGLTDLHEAITLIVK